MKTVLRVLYTILLVLSGLMFMRVILNLADVGEESVWAQPIFAVTNLLTAPISYLMFGETQPMFTLFGTKSILEPSVVVALFGTLVGAFIVTSIAHALERKARTPIISEMAQGKKSFWD